MMKSILMCIQVETYIQSSFAKWQTVGELTFSKIADPSKPIPVDISEDQANKFANSPPLNTSNIDIFFFFVK